MCDSGNAFGIEMFTGVYSTYLDSDSSNSKGCCSWKVVCPVGTGVNNIRERGWSMSGSGCWEEVTNYNLYVVCRVGLIEKMAFMQRL